MAQVQTLPEDRVIPVADDETLLHAMLREHIPIAHACGGNALCSTCRVRIEEGSEHCAPAGSGEQAIAKKLHFDECIRLACQLTTSGPVTVRRLVLDPQDEKMASQLEAKPAETAVGREGSLAILFSDINGFTALSEKLPAYDVMHLLNRYVNRAETTVELNGGYIDNYMGDGLMALFGVGEPEGAARQALHAGLDMLEAAEEMKGYVTSVYGLDFGVRIGVHFGAAVIGSLGRSRRRETVIGDAVNVASRIEVANKEAGTLFLASDAAVKEAGEGVRLGRNLRIQLRGQSGEHLLHEVLGVED